VVAVCMSPCSVLFYGRFPEFFYCLFCRPYSLESLTIRTAAICPTRIITLSSMGETVAQARH
jgi:hypothetical protein